MCFPVYLQLFWKIGSPGQLTPVNFAVNKHLLSCVLWSRKQGIESKGVHCGKINFDSPTRRLGECGKERGQGAIKEVIRGSRKPLYSKVVSLGSISRGGHTID